MIITLTTNITPQRFDVDIPGDLPISKVTKDLAECLTVLTGRNVNPDYLALSSNRLDKILMAENTLKDEGIWQGDVVHCTDVTIGG